MTKHGLPQGSLQQQPHLFEASLYEDFWPWLAWPGSSTTSPALIAEQKPHDVGASQCHLQPVWECYQVVGPPKRASNRMETLLLPAHVTFHQAREAVLEEVLLLHQGHHYLWPSWQKQQQMSLHLRLALQTQENLAGQLEPQWAVWIVFFPRWYTLVTFTN